MLISLFSNHLHTISNFLKLGLYFSILWTLQTVFNFLVSALDCYLKTII